MLLLFKGIGRRKIFELEQLDKKIWDIKISHHQKKAFFQF